MMAPVMSAGFRPCSAMSWVSQTAYSSAVRLASLEARHLARNVSPSKMAKTTLVLPESIATSMPLLSLSPSSRPLSALARQVDLAGGHAARAAVRQLQQQGTGGIEIGEDARQSLARQAHLDLAAVPLGDRKSTRLTSSHHCGTTRPASA